MTHVVAHAMMAGAVLIGGGSLLLFAWFVIAGPIAVVGLGFSETGALVWDGALSFLFFVQHSGMIRSSFRDRLAPRVPRCYHPAVFAIASGIALLAVVLLWQSVPTVLLRLEGVPRTLARVLSLLAILGFARGVGALGNFDTFGLDPIRARLRGRDTGPPEFVARGPYLWVRHPLYFFMLLLIWSGPDWTSDRLLFNSLWTAWTILGAILEEKDLVAEFGAQYLRYQGEVPMLLPRRGPRRIVAP